MNRPVKPDDAGDHSEHVDPPTDLSGDQSGRERPEAEAGGRDNDRPRHDVLELQSKETGTDGEAEKGGNGSAKGGPEDNKSDAPPPKAPPKIVFIAVGVVLLLCLVWGAYSHWRTYSEAKQTTSETVNRTLDVRTTAAASQDGPVKLTLPGQTDAFDVANIFPRATGYVSQRLVDIGSRVKQGDLLLHISAPDLDNQLAQAEAQKGQTDAAVIQAQTQVTQAEANVNLAKVTYARTDQLTQQGYQSLQNRDNQQANVETQQANLQAAKAGVSVAEANVRAQQATVDRLKALTAFEDVRAPFDGVITNRNVDVGALLNADTSSGQPILTIMRDTMIRVTARVPQNAAVGIANGLEATVHVPQMADRPFIGRVARTSEALLYSSRSLTVEVDVPNPEGLLRAGLYVSVDFQIPREHPSVSVPAEALIYNQRGMQVATVDGDTAKLHEATIYRDHGTWVELTDGLRGGERVILSPPATLRDGSKVKETRDEDEKNNEAKQGGSGGQPQADSPQNKAGNAGK